MSADTEEGGGREGQAVESVTGLTRRIRVLLEGGVGPCRVRGEVSNLRIQTSGHAYFTLKDAGAQISAVLFRGDLLRQPVKLREGMQLVAAGQLSVYEPRGQYQLVVRQIEEDGVGRLQREFELLKRRLAAEGLFEAGRKRRLPALPSRIGFVTSPTGAAVRDFMRILERRGWKGRAIVLGCKVQGEGSAEEIASMLAYAGSLACSAEGEPVVRTHAEQSAFFELLVVGRGGGSMEDLNAFNQEVLVRAVAACPVPVISAVGHETDVTLSDFAADVRAETPSGAAELVSSGFVAAGERCARLASLLAREMSQGLLHRRRRLDSVGAHLRLLSPTARVERGWQRLDDLSARLAALPGRELSRAGRDLRDLSQRLERASPALHLRQEARRLQSLALRLAAASPQSVLNRGFVIMRDEQGKPLKRASEVQSRSQLSAQFADGLVTLRTQD